MQAQIQEQIQALIASLPEDKRTGMENLHALVLRIMPGCQLWYESGTNAEGKTVFNPTVGYGLQTLHYAKGNTREFFQIGLSPNKTGFSVYIMGLKDKQALVKQFAADLGKASVTGYCIKFKSLKDIDLNVLEAAIRYGITS